MNRKNKERTPKPSKVEGRVVICADCGVAGNMLVKPDKDINKYYCANVLACKARQIKKLCSHSTCAQPRKYKCSCGMFLCENHARSYRLHPGHICTPLDKPKEKLKSLGNNNAKRGEGNRKNNLYFPVSHSSAMD